MLMLMGWMCLLASAVYCEERCLSNIEQLTFASMGFEKAGESYFSPDGAAIIFQAVPKGERHYQIFTMDLKKRVPVMVSTGQGACTCAYFRPDGKKIIFASSHSDPEKHEDTQSAESGKYKWELTPYMNIYESNPDGSQLAALTSGSAYHAECAYSSDGSEIVYASNEDGCMNIYVMDVDGSNVRQITHETASYNGGPFFSPDSKQIIFRADREKADYLQIFLIGRDGNAEKQLTCNGAVNWAPYWHPNGKVIAYTTSIHGHRQYEIYLLNVITKAEYRLTNSPTFDGLPSFSSDGQKIVWTSKRGGDACHVFMADFTMPQELGIK
jgi:Tol biopolymer transport system component